MKKLLYSPGYGAGWTTWEGDAAVRRFMVSYQPIIDALENGDILDEDHEAVEKLRNECAMKFHTVPYLGGVRNLEVLEVEDDVDVQFIEHDGYESYRFRDSGEWF